MAPKGRRNPKPAKESDPEPSASTKPVGYDGPTEGSASGQGSRGSAPSAAPRAQAGSASQGPTTTRGSGDQEIVLSRNVDFGGNAYNLNSAVSHFLSSLYGQALRRYLPSFKSMNWRNSL